MKLLVHSEVATDDLPDRVDSVCYGFMRARKPQVPISAGGEKERVDEAVRAGRVGTPAADDVTKDVDPECAGAQGVRWINGREFAVLEIVPVRNAVGIDEAAGDSTQDIDCEGARVYSLWRHDVAVTARIENESPDYAVAMPIETDDPSEIVDTLGKRIDRPGRIDRREAAIAEHKSVRC